MTRSKGSAVRSGPRDLANILPTDFELQGPAHGVGLGVGVVKSLVSRFQRRHDHLAKVRVAGSNPVVRSRNIKPRSEGDIIRLLAGAETNEASLLTYLFLDAETCARRDELAALGLDDFHGDSVIIAGALAVGLLNESTTPTSGRVTTPGESISRRGSRRRIPKSRTPQRPVQ